MATKSARSTKSTKKTAVVEKNEEESEEITPVSTAKKIDPVEFALPEDVAPIDEKAEADPLLPEDGGDDGLGDTGIDEEIDPFGDKWEQ